MAHPGDVVEAPLFGARATFLGTAEQTGGELLRVEVVLPAGFSISEHVHPSQEERHKVVRGTLEARVGGQQQYYAEGETAIGPAGVPHAWSNPSDSEELCIVSEHRPALHMEALLEGGFTIARDLQADKKGAPKHLLRLAMLLDEARSDFYMSSWHGQTLLRSFAALAPIGRLLGYDPLSGEAGRGFLTKTGGGIALGSSLLFVVLLILRWRARPRTP